MAEGITGIENEFELIVWHAVKADARIYLKKIIELSKKPFFRMNSNAFRLWTGGSLYSDGEEPEITTPPIEIEKGCVRRAVESLVQNRNNLVELVAAYNETLFCPMELEGYSAHYNFSEKVPAEMIEKIAGSAAIPFLLLIEQQNSQGIMLRDKDGRVEICGDYICNADQMRAAVAFMLGALQGIRGGKVPNRKIKRLWNKDVEVLGLDIKKKRDLKIWGRGTLQDMLEHYFRVFREDIGKFSEDEVELLEEFISGKRKLEADNENAPEDYHNVKAVAIPEIILPPLAAAFGRACAPEEIFGVKISPGGMEWEGITYNLGDEKHSLRVNREDLVEFYAFFEKYKKTLEGLSQQGVRAALSLVATRNKNGLSVFEKVDAGEIGRIARIIGKKKLLKRISDERDSYYIKEAAGSCGGQNFNLPLGIAADGKQVYVADMYNNRIVVLGRDLKDISIISNNPLLRLPQYVAEDRDQIYIITHAISTVVALNKETQQIKWVKGFNSQSPSGLAVDEKRIYITSAANKLVTILEKESGYLVETKNLEGLHSGAYFYGIAVDEERICMAEEGGNAFVVLDKGFNYQDRIQNYGVKDTPFSGITGIAVGKNRIFVTNSYDPCIAVFGKDLKPITDFWIGYEERNLSPNRIAVTEDRIYMTSQNNLVIAMESNERQCKRLEAIVEGI